MIDRYNICTIWSKGVCDPFSGVQTAGTARVYVCEVKRGGKTKFFDSTGSEFYPTSTFWVRLSDLSSGVHTEPKGGEMIAQGDHSGVTVPSDVGAEEIKAVIIHNHAKFGESDSYTIATNS